MTVPLRKLIERPRVEGVHGTGIHADRAFALIETVMTEIAFSHPEIIPGMELRDSVWAGLPALTAGGFSKTFVSIHKDDSIVLSFKDCRCRAHGNARRGLAVETGEGEEGNLQIREDPILNDFHPAPVHRLMVGGMPLPACHHTGEASRASRLV